MNNFYDGTKLLSLKDKDGNEPEIYICTSNRSAGKTTYFARLLVNKFIKNGEKFGIIYRFNYELDECADKFFKDIKTLFFNDYNMTSKRCANGIFHELYLNDKKCGYAITLNSADQLKKYSHLLSDTSRLMFDEFQSETNHYCSDEVKKFISIHTSIARGCGKQVRYLPVYMISNPISLLNPYYIELGISDILKNETKFLRGTGYVLEQGYNECASEQQKLSAFNKAFQNNCYINYSSQGVYLNDNLSFIEKLNGKSDYICTIKYDNCEYGVRAFDELGVLYCDDKPDISFNYKISITTNDHNVNYVMLKKESYIISIFKDFFNKGCFRFKNLKCKQAIFKMLSY